MIAVSIAAAGIYASHCVNKRIKLIEACVSLIKQFSCDIEYCRMPVKDIFIKAVTSGQFSDLSFLDEIASGGSEDFNERWHASVTQYCRKNPLLKSDLKLLESFGENLGTNDCEHQVLLCEEYVKRFTNLYENAMSKREEHMKICKLSGAAGAVLVLIMML